GSEPLEGLAGERARVDGPVLDRGEPAAREAAVVCVEDDQPSGGRGLLRPYGATEGAQERCGEGRATDATQEQSSIHGAPPILWSHLYGSVPEVIALRQIRDQVEDGVSPLGEPRRQRLDGAGVLVGELPLVGELHPLARVTSLR